MKLFYMLGILLLPIILSGCGKDDNKETKTTALPAALNAQLESAKQVNTLVQETAAQQRETIDKQTE